MKKTLTLFFIVCILQTNSKAQFYKSFVPSPGFTDSLNTVVTDFKNNFANIQGAPINLLEDVDVYRSIKSIPGAIETYVYRYHSTLDTSASWQAVLYDGDSYSEAAKIYKDLFRMMNKTRLKMEAFSTGFEGKLKAPSEAASFTISQLKATSPSAAYKYFIAEVEIINDLFNWKVRLNLHNKKPDDLY